MADDRADLERIMPSVSRALARGDRDAARRHLAKVIGRTTAAKVLDLMTRSPVPTTDVLTRAQWACLWNAACGLTAAEAGERFHRSTETVVAHRKAAIKRLGVRTIPAAIAEAYRHGLFDRERALEPVDW